MHYQPYSNEDDIYTRYRYADSASRLLLRHADIDAFGFIDVTNWPDGAWKNSDLFTADWIGVWPFRQRRVRLSAIGMLIRTALPDIDAKNEAAAKRESEAMARMANDRLNQQYSRA